MDNYNNTVMDYIQHFYDTTRPWDVRVRDEEVFIIQEEFPYLELYEKKWSCTYSGETGNFFVRMVWDVSLDHRLIYYKEKARFYEKEADRLYEGMRDLVG